MNETRPTWTPPPEKEIVNGLRIGDEATREDRAKRFQFILSEFGPDAHMLLVGGVPAMFAIHELKRSFIDGNYLATIVTAQAFVEHSLGGSFSMAGEDAIVNSGFARLIDESLAREWVSPELALRLHTLREMRNPYTHPKIGVPGKGYMERLMKAPVPDPETMAEQDAREAVRIVIDWLRDGSPDWAPRTVGQPWPESSEEASETDST